MIIATRNGGDRALRMFETQNFIPAPGEAVAIGSGDVRVPALQVASVACAVRLLSEELASLVMRVYQGDGQQRTPLYEHPLAHLFQEPAEGWTSFDLWADTVAATELERNAFLWKVIVKGRVEELYPISPDFCRVRRVKGTNRKVIEAWINGARTDVTENVVHVRGWSPGGGAEGVAAPDLHRRSLRTAAAYEEYRGSYFERMGMPGLVLEIPGKPSPDDRKEIVREWVRKHGGPTRSGGVGLSWGGMKVNPLGFNLKEAQAAELAEAIARDVARAWRIYPADLLHAAAAGSPRTPESTADLFFRFSLLPRARRIERALYADVHLFGQERARPRPYPRFDPSEFLRGDISTTANVIHMLVQDGVLTKNEGAR
ncbi:MAG: phage portal protein [Thermoleophilia bacterium]